MKKPKFELKTKGLKGSANFKAELIEQNFIEKYDHPVFCFEYLHPDHNIDKCLADEKGALLDQLVRWSTLIWNEIANTARHGLGTEKIAIKSIKPKCPDFITDEVSFLLAVRFQGKKPFLVHRDRFVAHIIFIDNKFEVYNH